MRFDVLTLFPDLFPGYLGQSLVKRAIHRGLVDVQVHDIRDWAKGKHRAVDDRPFGGGPGMVLRVEPVVECVEAVQEAESRPGHVILLTPRGPRLTQAHVERLAGQPRILLVCGRYEGFDERVVDILDPEEISIGDYVLGGGEIPALVILDAVIRLIPGVLGDETSNQYDSFSFPGRGLEHAQYTRPQEYRGFRVPDVLLSGNHPEIARWRQEQSRRETKRRREGNGRIE